ncbi:MAG: hypothetical protein QHI48_00320 [Bacteroidota bacterium]|nr:hypothetical protein [Bacteroidota bacterium]
MNRRIHILTVVSIWSFVITTASAQLSLVVQFEPLPSPYISDWRSHPNTIRFILTNPTGTPVTGRLKAYIEGDIRGRVAETKLNAKIQPITVPPGTSTFNAVDARFIEEGAIRYIGPTKDETKRTGRLPEDHFRICAQFVAYHDPYSPLSNESCATFEIHFLLPPSLITPSDTAIVQSLPVFQWSFVPLFMGEFTKYELKIVELEPGQKNPQDAILTNIPLLVRETDLPMYAYLPSDPPLEKGKTYAWRVQAFHPDSRFVFAKRGLSETWSFTYMPTIPPSIKTEEQTGGNTGTSDEIWERKRPSN